MLKEEMLSAVDILSNEKDVDKEIVIEALEMGFIAATKKKLGGEVDIVVSLDRETYDHVTQRIWTVVSEDQLEDIEEVFHTDRHLTVEQGQELGLSLNEKKMETIENIPMSRIAIQHARQALMSHVRKASKEKMLDRYQGRVGELLNGTVKKILRDKIVIDLGDSAEGMLLKEFCIPREFFREGDRVKTVLHELHQDEKGSQIVLSRSCGQMAHKLFEIEVPEIGDGIIEIKGIARDAGSCTKITVKSKDARIDPVGACVGVRGARVNAVSGEICDERIDIILWDDNIAQYAVNALSPAEVASIVVDEVGRSMNMYVVEENLAQAIGRNGQNVRLASRLIGWNINVVSENNTVENNKKKLVAQLNISEEIASNLAKHSIDTLESIVSADISVLERIEGIDAQAIQAQAEEEMLVLALSGDSDEDSLTSLEDVDDAVAQKLEAVNINSLETLAEQSTDDLLDLIDSIDADLAGKIIMQARQSWFNKE